MRTLFVAALFVVGCKSDPLHSDMEMFCRAIDVWHDNHPPEMHVPAGMQRRPSFVDIGPWIVERAKTDEVKHLMQGVKDGNTTIIDFIAQAKELVKKANLDYCHTLTELEKPAL